MFAGKYIDLPVGPIGLSVIGLAGIWIFFLIQHIALEKLSPGHRFSNVFPHTNKFFVLLGAVEYLMFLTTAEKTREMHVYILCTEAVFAGFALWHMYRSDTEVNAVPVANGPSGHSNGQEVEERNTPKRKSLIPSAANFSKVFGNDQIKRRLMDTAQAILSQKPGAKTARNGILLSGEPGSGKTAMAYALAGELKLPILEVSIGDVSSKWVGEKTQRIARVFENAKRIQPCVLFIDEVDSFLTSRDNLSSEWHKEDRDVVNTLLTLMVNIRKEKIILMAATNHMDSLDSASIREGRFDFKVEITPPDEAARIGLLKHGLQQNLTLSTVPDAVVESVAKRWNGYSAKRILAVTEELPGYLVVRGKMTPDFEDFMGALRQIQGRNGEVPENVKPLSELVLTAKTREMLNLIAARMADPGRTESLGGTLPTGVLFYGPPGTGKTATCKALAHKLRWTFLPATGPDLARDVKELEKLYAKAKELRPAIIFIDEADELLKSREYSSQTDATNKLLTLMDGVKDRVKDVVWIAATNNPSLIDQALLRGGRFTEKVVFEKPDFSSMSQYIANWLKSKNVALAGQLRVEDIIFQIGEESIANAEAIIQSGLNRAIARSDKSVTLTMDDVRHGARAVLGMSEVEK